MHVLLSDVSPPLSFVRDGTKSEVMSLSLDNWTNSFFYLRSKFNSVDARISINRK